jgi:hypothetical protein
MYFVAQISPLEWKKASVCNHFNESDVDDEINDTEFHHHDHHHQHSNSTANSIDGHEDFMTNREASECEQLEQDERILTSTIDVRDENCSENGKNHDDNNTRNNNDDVDNNKKNNSGSNNREDEFCDCALMADERGVENCCENYSESTLQQHQQYFKNMCVMNEQNDLESIWMSLEYRQNFLLNEKKMRRRTSGKKLQAEKRSKGKRLRQLQFRHKQHNEIGSSKERFDENDDGLIGYVNEEYKNNSNNENVYYDNEEFCQDPNECDADEDLDGDENLSFTSADDMQNIELISYVNNFSLKNSFAWTLGTLLQSTSDLYPKVQFHSHNIYYIFFYCNKFFITNTSHLLLLMLLLLDTLTHTLAHLLTRKN